MISLSELKNGILIKDKVVTLAIYVQPNAKRSEFEKIHDDQLKIKIKAPPEDGRANKEVIDFLSEFFSVSKQSVSLLKGHTSRKKKVQIVFDTPMSIEMLAKYF